MEKTIALFLILFLIQPSAYSQSRPVTQGDAISVNITPFARVPPTITIQVLVTTTPSPLPAGYSVSLVCETDAGTTGSATVSPSSISGSTTVTITGGTQSWGSGDTPAPNNIKLKATRNGHVYDTEDFTVCAHPINLCNILKQKNMQYGFQVDVVWESDSGAGNCGHLDRCGLTELVQYPVYSNPPFGRRSDGATLPESGKSYRIPDYPAESYIVGSACVRSGDTHQLYPNCIRNPIVAGSAAISQKYQFICRRCGSLNWNTLGEFSITATIYPKQVNGLVNFWFKLTKSGCYTGDPLESDELMIYQ